MKQDYIQVISQTFSNIIEELEKSGPLLEAPIAPILPFVEDDNESIFTTEEPVKKEREKKAPNFNRHHHFFSEPVVIVPGRAMQQSYAHYTLPSDSILPIPSHHLPKNHTPQSVPVLSTVPLPSLFSLPDGTEIEVWGDEEKSGSRNRPTFYADMLENDYQKTTTQNNVSHDEIIQAPPSPPSDISLKYPQNKRGHIFVDDELPPFRGRPRMGRGGRLFFDRLDSVRLKKKVSTPVLEEFCNTTSANTTTNTSLLSSTNNLPTPNTTFTPNANSVTTPPPSQTPIFDTPYFSSTVASPSTTPVNSTESISNHYSNTNTSTSNNTSLNTPPLNTPPSHHITVSNISTSTHSTNTPFQLNNNNSMTFVISSKHSSDPNNSNKNNNNLSHKKPNGLHISTTTNTPAIIPVTPPKMYTQPYKQQQDEYSPHSAYITPIVEKHPVDLYEKSNLTFPESYSPSEYIYSNNSSACLFSSPMSTPSPTTSIPAAPLFVTNRLATTAHTYSRKR
eukprot:TRINITY_DN1670_c0_g2_i2.p1 TRINITY_DN1670_c0_g2~~TRINITY_DN1670_c0_g2_i2.p1  ORF type:complete len:547 (-),score=116.84 TRINITY_DN1670_c0_g2_i2:1032-2546(-)